MAHVEDRWTTPNPDGGRRLRGPRYGSGSRWLAVWNEPGGQRCKRAFDTKDAAQAHIEDQAAAMRTGRYVSAAAGQITLRDMAERWYREQLHQRSTSLESIRRRLDRSILPVLGHAEVGELDRAAIQEAVTGWAADLAPATVRLTYIYLAGVLSLAVQERRLVESPCQRINLPAVSADPVVPMTVLQVQGLIDALWTPYRRLAVFVAATGVRPGEGRGLTWDRITRIGSTARVRIDRQLTSSRPTWGPPKTKWSARSIGIGPGTLEALGETGTGLVFLNHRGRPITRSALSDAWRAAGEKIGLPIGTGWHDLRHFHASMLIAQGASPVAVAHRLGHKDATETLKTYAHLWPDDDEKMRDGTDGAVVLRETPAAPTQPPRRSHSRSEGQAA